ncbi:outer membrane protein assembly factor BamA [Galbibacter sp.]|uniref:outer membrane protein assembly factor BamA n=1 Tax=Galbibacter sp. TaxID=2918471 RepID=UPI003A8DB27D
MWKRYLGILLLLLTYTEYASAQDTTFDKGEEYILGGIEVTGVKSYNDQSVISYTGWRIGQKITVPGEEISDVISKLWGLNFFSDINIYKTKIVGDKIYLEINVVELPTLADVKVTGIKERKVEDLIKEADLKIGKKVTEGFLANTKSFLTNKYKKEGFLNTKVNINTIKTDTVETNNEVKMVVAIDRGEKVKVGNIEFHGNEKLSDKKLRKAMKNTKQKVFGRFWKKSKFIPEDFDVDITSVIDTYKENGYRDARIISDTIVRQSDKTVDIDVTLEEGNKYYFGELDFVGNTAYSDQQLGRILGLKRGDVYNGVLFDKRIEDNTKPDGNTIANLYQNNGYLFSQINPVEVSAKNDTIDFEVRIVEGKLAYFQEVTVSGNERTNDHVIYRELRTRPGQLYSKENVVRTIRELGQLGYFDPETIDPQIKDANPETGTVGINYALTEKGSSQIELQGGYGGGGFIGTVGLSFNNFSIRNILNGKEYKPVPMGDGQRLSLRLQASRFFQTYSFSFVEPWLGGKKPVQFSTSVSRTLQFRYNPRTGDADKDQRFVITGATVGLAKRLRWPDDHFQLSHALSYQHYDLQNYNTSLFTFGNGYSHNLAYTIALSRNNTYVNPIFPMGGSEWNISLKLSPPYSLFNNIDYANLGDDPKYQMINSQNQVVPDQPKIDQEKYKWQEFYKIKFSGNWYTNIVAKLVLKTGIEFGFLGAYNDERGVIPFERFFLGGDGLGNYTLDGRDNISLRGYPNQSLSGIDGSTVYNKFSLELRYPITLKPTASIYGLTFVEGGSAYDTFSQYNPFNLKRSAGLGVRIFMPAFGLLGIDFGYGFDPVPGEVEASGWQTHFIIGQQF